MAMKNMNVIYPALVAAHNGGNRSAISKDLILGCGIDNIYLVRWSSDVEKLRKAVWAYFALRVEVQNGRADKHDLEVAFNKLYPLWKNLLAQGERKTDERELHADQYDIEDIIGFAWDFFWIDGMSVGTQIAATDSKKFRQKIEALVGCKIAGVAVLTDSQRKKMEDYHKAVNQKKTLEEAMAAREDEIKKAQELFNAVKDMQGIDPVIDKFAGELKTLQDEQKAATEKLVEVKAKITSLEAKVKKIERDLKTAQI